MKNYYLHIEKDSAKRDLFLIEMYVLKIEMCDSEFYYSHRIIYSLPFFYSTMFPKIYSVEQIIGWRILDGIDDDLESLLEILAREIKITQNLSSLYLPNNIDTGLLLNQVNIISGDPVLYNKWTYYLHDIIKKGMPFSVYKKQDYFIFNSINYILSTKQNFDLKEINILELLPHFKPSQINEILPFYKITDSASIVLDHGSELEDDPEILIVLFNKMKDPVLFIFVESTHFAPLIKSLI